MGALLSICFKSRGDETQARSKCQQKKKRKLTKQKSLMGGPPMPGLLGDSGRSSSSGYSSTETGPPPSTLDRTPSWSRGPAGNTSPGPGEPPQGRPAHPKMRETSGLQRTLSFNLPGSSPERSPSQRRRTFKKSGRKK